MKTRGTVAIEGALYVVIAAGAPWVELLISDRDLTPRTLAAAAVMAIVAGATALKAFLSQAMENAQQRPVPVVTPPNQPLEVTDADK